MIYDIFWLKVKRTLTYNQNIKGEHYYQRYCL